MKSQNLFSIIFICTFSNTVLGQQNLDAYINQPDSNKFVVVASASNSLSSPIDLDFYPDQSKRPNELWILNQGAYNAGGSTVIVSKANQSTRTWKYVKDGNAWHFMAMASSMAFGDSNWATAQDILDANRSTGKYTGPTLWSGNLSIYGVIGNPSTTQFNGSHLDMIHQSPYGKGIAFEKDNVFWVMDGYDGTLKRYEFGEDHGPGQEYHGDGGVRVYSELKFTRSSTLPCHIVIDQKRKYLYGCDALGKRVFRVDITTGAYNADISKVNSEILDGGYYEFTGLSKQDSLIKGLSTPVGIDIYGERLIVTDNGTDEIIIYDLLNNCKELGRIKLTYAANPDPMGVKVGPDGRIYFVDKTNKKAYMIDNNAVWPLNSEELITDMPELYLYPNPAENTLNIRFAHSEPVSGNLSIMNILGETIITKQIATSDNEINISPMASGVYIVQLKIGNKLISQKFIKQ